MFEFEHYKIIFCLRNKTSKDQIVYTDFYPKHKSILIVYQRNSLIIQVSVPMLI